MAKSKVTPITPAPQSAPKLIGAMGVPLERAVFHWPKPPGFPIAHEGETLQVSGRMVGALLSWLSRAWPGAMTTDGAPWNVSSVCGNLEGLAETLRGLSGANLEGIPADADDIHFFLANVTGDLAAQLATLDKLDTEIKDATVTIGGTPVVEAAR